MGRLGRHLFCSFALEGIIAVLFAQFYGEGFLGGFYGVRVYRGHVVEVSLEDSLVSPK